MLSTYKSSIPLSFVLFSSAISIEGSYVGSMNFKHAASLSALLAIAWSTMFKGVLCDKQDVERHLELGKKMLAAGQLSDALTHYHAAVEGDPTNYLTFYRRATVLLALGRSKSALPDLDKVIELKPDFTSARVQRGNVMLKLGNIEDARDDYTKVLQTDNSNQEVIDKLGSLDGLLQDRNSAESLMNSGDHQAAIDLYSKLIDLSPWDPRLREHRASCYESIGDYFKAIHDIKPTTKLRNDNTQGFYKISSLYYAMGDADESLVEIRECLKLDPDHKECFSHYKKVKKLAKQIDSARNLINEQKWDDCISKSNAMLKTENQIFSFVHRAKGYICHCESRAGNFDQAIKACDELLKLDERNVDAICDKAEAYLLNEQYSEAVELFKKAHEIDPNSQKAQDGQTRAQKLFKQSQKRDYYKILGLKRNCNKRDVTKAYRKLAQKWHPDKYNGNDRVKAEKMFVDIAAAKEVLSDPEKRKQFDNGEDPLDAEEQSQRNNPWSQGFQEGFNPFGSGGGFQFKFHFN